MSEKTRMPVVVVTGCSSGIGRSTVSHLAAGGFQVIAGIRRTEDADELQRESTSILPVMLDVADPDSIAQAASTVREHFPDGVDGLINNAGISVSGPLELVPRDQWQRQFDVNVFGIVSVTQSFLPMLRCRRGRIVNISSAASSLALPMVGAYASSKFAVEGLSDSLRRELSAFGIKVVVVCPGQTATRIFSTSEGETETRLQSPPDSVNHDYTAALTRLQELMHRSESLRRPPARVASVIVKALTTRYPKRRYHVGWDAHATAVVQRFVPAALVDWGIARMLRPSNSPDSRNDSSRRCDDAV